MIHIGVIFIKIIYSQKVLQVKKKIGLEIANFITSRNLNSAKSHPSSNPFLFSSPTFENVDDLTSK